MISESDLSNHWKINYKYFNYVDSISEEYNINEENKNDIAFFIRENNKSNFLVNLLFFISKEIKSKVKNVNLELKLIDGDLFNENLLGVFVFFEDFEDSLILNQINDLLYQKFDCEDIDKIYLAPEF